jgi:hypothetical protein
MDSPTKTTSRLFLAAIAAAPFMTACGGGEEESKSSNQQADNSFNLLGCVAGLFIAQNGTYCGTSSNSAGSSGTGTTSQSSGTGTTQQSSGTIRILGQYEIEPNDDLLNADPVSFSSSTDGKVGFRVDANISDIDDHHDYFTFVRPRARDLRFQLCPPDQTICENSVQVDTLTAYYDILDQDGNVLASTQAAAFNVNVLSIDAGVSYYVRVTAGDTMATTVGYTLTVYETN